MGKTFIYVAENGRSLKDAYEKLFAGNYEVIEASAEKFFYRIPSFAEVVSIELGTDRTKETIVRLSNNGFVVINKTLDIHNIKEA